MSIYSDGDIGNVSDNEYRYLEGWYEEDKWKLDWEAENEAD